MISELSNTLQTSAAKALKDFLAVKTSEKILLIFDDSTKEIADAFLNASIQLDLNLRLKHMKPTGGHGKEPGTEIADLMKKFPVVIAPTRFSLTHTKAVREANNAGSRVATLPGIDALVFVDGLKADPLDLKTTGESWQKVLRKNHKIHIESTKGTDIEFSIGMYPVMNDDGCLFEKGIYGNLPAGEVFVAPDPGTAAGTLVIDGTIGGLAWHKNSPPATLILKDGAISTFEGKRAKSLEETLGRFGGKSRVLAEFGIGTNRYLKMTGNLLGDEKIKGTVHVAFGNNRNMGGDNDVQIHIDCLIIKPDLYIDKKPAMKNGEWLI